MLNWWGLGSAYKSTPAIGWTLVTFGIFAFLVKYFAQKPLAAYLKSRSEEIKNAIEEAKQAKQDAQNKLRQYEQRLLDLDTEILKMKSDFEHQGQLERARLKQEAEKIAEQIRKDSEQTLKAEVSRSVMLLKQEIAEKIILTAQQNLSLSPDVDWKLCHNFIEQTARESA